MMQRCLDMTVPSYFALPDEEPSSYAIDTTVGYGFTSGVGINILKNLTFSRYIETGAGIGTYPASYYKIDGISGLTTDQKNILRSNINLPYVFNQETLNCVMLGVIKNLITRIEDLENP